MENSKKEGRLLSSAKAHRLLSSNKASKTPTTMTATIMEIDIGRKYKSANDGCVGWVVCSVGAGASSMLNAVSAEDG